MHELKNKLMSELMEYGKGELTHASLEVIDRLAHALKNVCKIEEYGCCDSEKYEKSGTEIKEELKAIIEKIENM